jgi:hypothetical protein
MVKMITATITCLFGLSGIYLLSLAARSIYTLAEASSDLSGSLIVASLISAVLSGAAFLLAYKSRPIIEQFLTQKFEGHV